MSKKIIIASLALVAISSFTLTGNAFAYPGMDEKNEKGNQQQQYEDGRGKGSHNFHDGKGRNDHRRNGRNSEYHEERMKKMHEQFEALTDAQKLSLEKMTDEHRDDMDPIKTSLASKKAEYRALMQHSNPNPKEAGRLAGEISVLQQKQRDLREAYAEEVEEKFGLDLDFGPMGHGRNGGHGGFGGNRNGYCM